MLFLLHISGKREDHLDVINKIIQDFKKEHPELQIERFEVLCQQRAKYTIDQVDGIKIFHHRR